MVPVTLLSGPVAALRADVLRCLVLRRPGLVAVSYDLDPGADQLLTRTVRDAHGLQHREQVEAVGCCLACTVRADAPAALRLVDSAARWGEVVMSLPSAVQADDVVDELAAAGWPVDTVTAVVDARILREQLSGHDLLADRGEAAAPEDRRSTAELVAGHLEAADVVAVAELHRLGTTEARTVEALLAHLAPLAVQVTVAPGGVGCEEAVFQGRSEPVTVDRERLATLAGSMCPPACGVTTVVWSSEEPLHYARLQEALPDLVSGLVRSRGHVWLLDRFRERLRWEQAGGSLRLGDPQPWDSLPSSELVLTGIGVDADELRARLDACVATDEELAAGSAPEPLPDAQGAAPG